MATVRSEILAARRQRGMDGRRDSRLRAAAADALAAGGKGNTAIGYADNADSGMGLTTFGGQTVDSNSILLRYTISGDANLDGTVGLSDFLALRKNFGLASNATWDEGDFDYDGKVNLNDFLILRSTLPENRFPRGFSAPAQPRRCCRWQARLSPRFLSRRPAPFFWRHWLPSAVR